MAAPTQIGTATVWGLDGTLAYTGMATTANLLESMSYEDTVQEHESLDKLGETVGLKLWNDRKTLTINFYPSSPAGAGAVLLAKSNVVLPAKGSTVTIAAMQSPAGGAGNDNGVNSATWLYVGGGSIEYTNAGEVKMVLPLRRYKTDLSVATS